MPIFCDSIKHNADVSPENIQLSDSISEQRREKTSQNATSDRQYPYITESIPHTINGYFVVTNIILKMRPHFKEQVMSQSDVSD